MTYSYDTLKKNLTQLMKERSLRIVDLEAKANRGRIVNNILSGSSTNPTIDTVKSLAEALNIDIEDLLSDRDLNKDLNPFLLKDAFVKVMNEIDPIIGKYSISFNNVLSLIKEAYYYAYDLNLKNADEQFIKWIIKQRYNF